MKQTIEYYYSLKIDEIYLEGDAYYFRYEENDYYFVFFNRSMKDIEDIIECSKQLKMKNINSHDIIINNQNEIITKVDEVAYILLKVIDQNREYSIIDIMDQNKKTKLSSLKSNLYRNDWATLWSMKIDYIENQMNEINCDRITRKSIDYYIGLAENAIYYVNLTKEKYRMSSQDNIVLSHRRIYYPNLGLNYCNPLTYIFDLEVRDVAEYIKALFFYDDMEEALEELKLYFKLRKLTPFEYQMFFGRMLFPSYYFDVYEKVINNEILEDELLKIIDKSSKYEFFLEQIYKIINQYYVIERIGWIKKEL